MNNIEACEEWKGYNRVLQFYRAPGTHWISYPRWINRQYSDSIFFSFASSKGWIAYQIATMSHVAATAFASLLYPLLELLGAWIRPLRSPALTEQTRARHDEDIAIHNAKMLKIIILTNFSRGIRQWDMIAVTAATWLVVPVTRVTLLDCDLSTKKFSDIHVFAFIKYRKAFLHADYNSGWQGCFHDIEERTQVQSEWCLSCYWIYFPGSILSLWI